MAARIRRATPADGAAMAAIYGPVVEASATSFELEIPDADEMARRIAALDDRHPWIVLDEDGAVTGYAYACPFRARAAYRWTVETSVYVHPDHHRRGVGRALMVALLDALRRAGFHRAVAGATLPNEGSRGLHEALGFAYVGTFREVGNKLGAWHDVGFWDLELAPLDALDAPEPAPPGPILAGAEWAAAAEEALGALRPAGGASGGTR